MDILYPCSLCSQTFTLRNNFLIHIETVHQSNISLVNNLESKSVFNCSQCYKQFTKKCFLSKHIYMKHNVQLSTKNTSKLTQKNEEFLLSHNYLMLKVSLNFNSQTKLLYSNLYVIYFVCCT